MKKTPAQLSSWDVVGFHLQSSPKTYTLDQDKAETPERTVAAAKARLAQIAELAELKIEARPTEVEAAFSFGATGPMLATSGKGLTREQAMASAVMEFVERYSWLHYDYQHNPGYMLAPYAAVGSVGLETVEPEYFFANFISLADRAALDRQVQDIPLRWVLGTRLLTGTPYFVPLNWHNLLYSSNGLAAGNTPAEAVVQGLCETIERENVYRLFVESKPGYDVPVESITHPLLRAAIETAKASGIEFAIKDISFDFGVPCFAVRGTRSRDEGQLTYQGFGQGCHTDAAKALMRAISEYVEGLTNTMKVQTALGGDSRGFDHILPEQHLGFHAGYNPKAFDQSAGEHALADIAGCAKADIMDEATAVAQRLDGHGHTVVVVDKTHPKLDIAAVRVFVPSFRSCINTDIQSPSRLLGAVYFEAGDQETARTYWSDALAQHPLVRVGARNPFVRGAIESILGRQRAAMPYARDYRETMKAAGQQKTQGMNMLCQLAGMQSVLGPALEYLRKLEG